MEGFRIFEHKSGQLKQDLVGHPPSGSMNNNIALRTLAARVDTTLWYFGKECTWFFTLVLKIFQRLNWRGFWLMALAEEIWWQPQTVSWGYEWSLLCRSAIKGRRQGKEIRNAQSDEKKSTGKCGVAAKSFAQWDKKFKKRPNLKGIEVSSVLRARPRSAKLWLVKGKGRKAGATKKPRKNYKRAVNQTLCPVSRHVVFLLPLSRG